MRAALLASVGGAWQASSARFGQARALSNARRAATGLSRDRVAREEVRLYLESLRPDGEDADLPRQTQRQAAAGSDT